MPIPLSSCNKVVVFFFFSLSLVDGYDNVLPMFLTMLCLIGHDLTSVAVEC